MNEENFKTIRTATRRVMNRAGIRIRVKEIYFCMEKKRVKVINRQIAG